MTLPTLLQAMRVVRELKEETHKNEEGMVPIVELIRDGEIVAVIGMADFETNEEKVRAFKQCLFAARSLKAEGVRLLIDAHMSKYDKDEFEKGSFVRPSQDPKAVDVILGYQWKDGQPTHAAYEEYHYLDDGTLEWKDIQPFPKDAFESWMSVEVEAAYDNTMPVMDDVMELGEFMVRHGHAFALMLKNEGDTA